jgi:hypothetical protein
MSIEDIKKGLDAIGYVISDGAQVQIAKDILIEVIKQAEKQEPVAWYDPEVMHEDRGISWTHGQFHTAPLYTVLPRQKQQGMTAEIERLKDALNKSESRLHEVAVHCEQVERDRDAALLALRQAEQPWGWRWKECINGELDNWVVTSSEPPPYAIEKQPLYTALPQRKPLTDEEIRAVYGDDLQYRDGDYMRFARAIEAAHGIGEKA